MRALCRSPLRSRQGFTLIELLVTIAVMLLLLALIVPSFRSVGDATQLTNGAAMLVSEMNLARQTALTEHKEIEIRFYKLLDGSGQSPAFRSFQLFAENGSQQLGTIKRLPGRVIMVEEEKYSTILSGSNHQAENNGTMELHDQGEVGYKSFRFRSSGTTNLDPRGASDGADEWFITLKLAQSPPGESEMPASNFITVQIDPVNGRSRTFQP